MSNLPLPTLSVTKTVSKANQRKKLKDRYKQIVNMESEYTHIKKGHKGFLTVPEEQHKNKIQGFALTEVEANYITLTAQYMGISKSTLIRRALRSYLLPEEVIDQTVDEMQGQLFED